MYTTRRGKLPRWIRAAQQISNPLFRRKRPLESTCPVFETYSMERLLLVFRPFPSLFFPSLNNVYNIRPLFFHLFLFRSTHLKTYLRIFIKLVFTNRVPKVSSIDKFSNSLIRNFQNFRTFIIEIYIYRNLITWKILYRNKF